MTWDFPYYIWVNYLYCAAFNFALEFHCFWQFTVNTHLVPSFPAEYPSVLINKSSVKLHLFWWNWGHDSKNAGKTKVSPPSGHGKYHYFLPGPPKFLITESFVASTGCEFQISVTVDGMKTGGPHEGVFSFSDDRCHTHVRLCSILDLGNI